MLRAGGTLNVIGNGIIPLMKLRRRALLRAGMNEPNNRYHGISANEGDHQCSHVDVRGLHKIDTNMEERSAYARVWNASVLPAIVTTDQPDLGVTRLGLGCL